MREDFTTHSASCLLLYLTFLLFGCVAQPAPQHSLMISAAPELMQMVEADSGVQFYCPQKMDSVHWLSILYAPDIYTHLDTTWIFFTARENEVPDGISRIGAATSVRGKAFQIEPSPILFPERESSPMFVDALGVEEPRVVRDESGVFWMTYNSLDVFGSRVSIARSEDLRVWTKVGAVTDGHSKSGVILSRQSGQDRIAKKVDGYFHLFWGDKVVRLLRSKTLKKWEPHLTPSGKEHILIGPRWDCFDSEWVSPVSAVWSEEGTLLLYNGGLKESIHNREKRGIGQVVLDPKHTLKVIARSRDPLTSNESFATSISDHPVSSLGYIESKPILLLSSKVGGVFGASIESAE